MCNQLVTIEVQEKFHARLGKKKYENLNTSNWPDHLLISHLH